MIGDAFKAHLRMGKANGITKEEIVEMITQLAFYCDGQRRAALPLVKEVSTMMATVMNRYLARVMR